MNSFFVTLNEYPAGVIVGDTIGTLLSLLAHEPALLDIPSLAPSANSARVAKVDCYLISRSFLILALTASTSAGPYPLDLNTAVRHAYDKYLPVAGFTEIVQTCTVDSGAPAREAALVLTMNPSSGQKDLSAYMFISTAGWTPYGFPSTPLAICLPGTKSL